MAEKQFETVTEFQEYYNKIPDKEVKKWTTKDWLGMYQKLDVLLMKDKEFKAEALKYGENKFGKDVVDNLDDLIFMQFYFSRFRGRDTLIHLNKNYKLPKDDFEVMIDVARKLGKNLAKKGIDISKSNVNQSDVKGERMHTTEIVDKVVFDITNYAKYDKNPQTNEILPKYDELGSEIDFIQSDGKQNNLISLGNQYFKDDRSSEIEVSPSAEKDRHLSTSVHEAVHAYLQIGNLWQKEQLDTGLKPIDGLSDDFMELLKYNRDYYVESRDAADRDKVKNDNDGYKMQPVEKMAQVIGLTSEHYFRQETQQYSERNMRRLERLVKDDALKYTSYTDDGKVYGVFDMDKMKIASEDGFKNKYLKNLDKEVQERLTMKVFDKDLYILVPNDETLGRKLTAAMKSRDLGNAVKTTLNLGKGR